MPNPTALPGASCQHTLAQPVSLSGIALHGGQSVRLQLLPAPAGHGVVFQRDDLPLAISRLPAHWNAVVDTRLCTVLGNPHGVQVSTVEHLLSALAGCAIDNVIVSLDGPEVPILDGSAAGWMDLLDQAGRRAQAVPRRRLQIRRPLRVAMGDSWAKLLPAQGSRYRVGIDFEEPLIGRQQCELRLTIEGYRAQIARARTFGFACDVEAMLASGRARGGSLDNAVLIADGKVLNPEGLRWPDEFVRHKLLDCIGDLYLAGAPIEGQLIAHRPGHALNVQILRELFQQPDCWQWSSTQPCALAHAA